MERDSDNAQETHHVESFTQQWDEFVADERKAERRLASIGAAINRQPGDPTFHSVNGGGEVTLSVEKVYRISGSIGVRVVGVERASGKKLLLRGVNEQLAYEHKESFTSRR